MSASRASSGPTIRVIGLRKRFGAITILEDVSFDVAPGEVVAVLGASGAGKTTLFRCLTRLIKPDAGQIYLGTNKIDGLDGRALMMARRDVGLVFQQYNLIRRRSALDNVLAGRLGHVPAWRVICHKFPRADRQLAFASLDRVGMLAYAYQRADTLSGGQQQRVAIARTLAQQSRLILADEPVSSLDPETANSILAILRSIAREWTIAVLVSLHQVEFALKYADRVIGLRDGRLIADHPVDEFARLDHRLIYAS